MKEKSTPEPTSNLSPEYRERYTDLTQKLDSHFLAGLTYVGDVAGEITKKEGIGRLGEIYKYLIDTAQSNLKFIPKHTEEVTSVILMNIHSYYGPFVTETRTITVPDKWTLTLEGYEKIDKYLQELRKNYAPRTSLQKFIRRILRD